VLGTSRWSRIHPGRFCRQRPGSPHGRRLQCFENAYIEVAPLLQHVGLSERDLDNRQHRVSANAQAKLLECAAEALGDSAFGLHLAQQANLREAGLRTLSRKLAGEGTTYDELVDQLRRSLALQYIKAPSITVSQIAWLLGYEGSTSFNHAFKRWTGRSPTAWSEPARLSTLK
jgi:AraC-like DNA-binding protein